MADQVICDSIVKAQHVQIEDLKERKELGDRELGKALEQIDFQEEIIRNQNGIVVEKDKIIESKDTEIKKQKRHKVLSFLGMLVSLGLAVVT